MDGAKAQSISKWFFLLTWGPEAQGNQQEWFLKSQNYKNDQLMVILLLLYYWSIIGSC